MIDYILCKHLKDGSKNYLIYNIDLGDDRYVSLCDECATNLNRQVMHRHWKKVIAVLNPDVFDEAERV